MDDLISRQAALEKVRAMQTYKLFMGDDMILVDKAKVQTELMMLPSAQPEPQEGEWEQVSAQRYFMSASYFYRCSACGVNNVRNTNYCPNCGAKMIISTK